MRSHIHSANICGFSQRATLISESWVYSELGSQCRPFLGLLCPPPKRKACIQRVPGPTFFPEPHGLSVETLVPQGLDDFYRPLPEPSTDTLPNFPVAWFCPSCQKLILQEQSFLLSMSLSMSQLLPLSPLPPQLTSTPPPNPPHFL